jgi:flavin-dependent dehydrogenase
MSAIVIEPHTGSVDKACGEGIMPAGRRLLDKMEVDIQTGVPFGGVRYHQNGKVATGRFHSGDGIGVRRTHLSEALWNRAELMGVERRTGRIRSVEFRHDSVLAEGITARWLVGADGLHSTVRKCAGIGVRTIGRPRYGVRRHFKSLSESSHVDVYLDEESEIYVTPVANGVVGVAVLSMDASAYEEQLDKFPQLKERLGSPIGPAKGAGPFGRFSTRVYDKRVALVGDAAGFLDPITGEGIRLGIEAADYLVTCLKNGDISSYGRGWNRIVRNYRWVTGSVLALRRNPVTSRAMVSTLCAMPSIFDYALGLLGDR